MKKRVTHVKKKTNLKTHLASIAVLSRLRQNTVFALLGLVEWGTRPGAPGWLEYVTLDQSCEFESQIGHRGAFKKTKEI